MIDMSKLYRHIDYPPALIAFNVRHKWSEFQSVHLNVSNNKCPICECSLKEGELLERVANKGVTQVQATIDHYRPQNFYSFLRHEHENYLLMCSECNRIYKGNLFPLYVSTPNRATTLAELADELPLLVNPITDNLLELFKLKFLFSPSGKKVLELAPKHENGYLFEKASETINLFCLGDCEVIGHSNESVKTLRITLLHSHFKKFENFIKAFERKDVVAMRDEVASKRLNEYGFLKFILNNQYQNLIPN